MMRLFLIQILLWLSIVRASTSTTSSTKNKIVVGIDGGTESIRAACFDANTGKVIGKACAVPYQTYHPKPGYAEQLPDDWWNNLGQAVKGAVESIPTTEGENVDDVKSRICAIAIDTTCCSVVALDAEKKPLRPSLLWMDARSAKQTEQIMKVAKGDAALKVNCNGKGPLSAEWMTPKCLWLKQNEPEVWEKAETICEYQDYINYKLTGRMCASACNAAARWHWNGGECVKDPSDKDQFPGRPMSLYRKLKMTELAKKLPQKCFAMGDVIGTLTKEASEHLCLPENVIVAQGGPDAFVGMVGLGCIYPQQLCLITGSSHLHCVITAKPTTAKAAWGAYKGAPLTGTNFAEGGQSSTGSIIRWAKKLFNAEDLEYSVLDEEAAAIPAGSDGLIALETFQGSRTPVTDPLARGALVGLTLSHTRAHIWRSLMEAVCFGTRGCIEGLEKAGHKCDEIIIAGGTTRSPLWLQMHADVTKKPIVLCENIDAPLLGSAILASVGADVHSSVQDAVSNMVRVSRRVEPNQEAAKQYDDIYNEVYSRLSSSVRPIVHSIAKLRGGACSEVEVSPSVLAADWGNMNGEIKRCLDAGLKRIHVDMFDGVYLNSSEALTFGPKMVKDMRKYSKEIIMDVHLCVEKPHRYIDSLADAGANSVIFQFEAMSGTDDAICLAKKITENGLDAAMSLNPSTTLDQVKDILITNLFTSVIILGVNPGFGGQSFQNVNPKIKDIKQFIEENNLDTEIVVDGGMNAKTVHAVVENGAATVIAGSFLFQHPVSFEQGLAELRGQNSS